MSFVADLRCAFRSFTRAKGLALTVIVTLGLGIGANAAMFSVVQGVLLRPLVNRDESRLIYIRQSTPGITIAPAKRTAWSSIRTAAPLVANPGSCGSWPSV